MIIYTNLGLVKPGDIIKIEFPNGDYYYTVADEEEIYTTPKNAIKAWINDKLVLNLPNGWPKVRDDIVYDVPKTKEELE